MIIEFSDLVFSRNLRYLRKKRRLSILVLSILSGVPVRALSEIENSTAPPRITADRLHRICHVFGYPVELMIHTDLEKELPK